MRKFGISAVLLVAGVIAAISAVTASGSRASAHKQSVANPVTLLSAGSNWPNYGGGLGQTRYSSLTQINPSNVANLQLAFGARFTANSSAAGENSPIVVGNTMFASNGGTMAAFDATTGAQLWEKTNVDRNQKPTQLSITPTFSIDTTGVAERGTAIGGGLIYAEETDGTMVGFNEYTGLPVWQTHLNPLGFHTYSPPAPVYWNGMVYVGLSGSDTTTGLHATFTALDAKTGKIVWQFNITPQAGGPGADTWGNPAELANGGGANWVGAAIDPKLGTIYVPTGNPFPDFGRKAGDDNFTDGVVALDSKTGKVKWFYQTTHHDEWDYDCAQPAALWDQTIGGKLVHGLELACKNGYVYELNRETGVPITPVKETPLSNAKTDPEAATLMTNTYDWKRTGGKPLTEPIPVGGAVTQHCADPKLLPGPAPDGKPFEYACTYNYYSADHYVAGTTESSVDWQPMSVNAKLGYAYICSNNGIRAVKMGDPTAPQVSDAAVWPQLLQNGNGGAEPRLGWFTALNLQNNKIVWQNQYAATTCVAGSATTASGLTFAADGSGKLLAYDAKTGALLSSYTQKGMAISGPPIVYEENGKEYVAFSATVPDATGTNYAEVVSLDLP